LTLQKRIEDENVVKYDLMILNGLYVFLSLFGDPCPLCKYDLLEENNPSCLLHNLLYMEVILKFTFYLLT
jgi:hypothetical protein